MFTWQTEAEGRLWGVAGADALVPAACLALMPPAARRRPRSSPAARCMRRVWVEGCSLSPHCWGSSPRDLERPGEQVGGATRPAPGAQPCPSLIPLPRLAWPLAGSIGPLTRCQHSPPANFAPSLIPLTSSPCAKPCAQAGLLPRENRSFERGWEPLGSDHPTPQPCRSPAGGPRPSCCAAWVSSLWLYHMVRLLLTPPRGAMLGFQ